MGLRRNYYRTQKIKLTLFPPPHKKQGRMKTCETIFFYM